MRNRPGFAPPKSTQLRAIIYCLTLVFVTSFSWSIIRVISFAKGQGLVSDVLSRKLAGALDGAVLWSLIWQLTVALIVHIVFAFLLWWLAHRILVKKPVSADRYLNGCFLLALVGTYWLFFTNALLFPNSWNASLPVFSSETVNLVATISLSCVLAVIFIIGSNAAMLSPKRFAKRSRRTLTIALIAVPAISAIAVGSVKYFYNEPSISQRKYPDIIMLGIDSLSLDQLSSDRGRSIAPTLHKIIGESVVFDRAYTPLAQTFPAWVSILSGQYPANTGIRANLVESSRLSASSPMLSSELQTLGYKTVYATDEKLFSNIDESFGFDEIVGARMGAADFLINYFNDIPLHNLLVNTLIGKWLFPFSQQNRAAYHTYEPSLFANAIGKTLETTDPHRPLFLATHLCLAHWPYVWKEGVGEPLSLNDPERIFEYTMRALDSQVQDILGHLSRSGRLSNAVLVLLSDHGEQYEAKSVSAWTNVGSPLATTVDVVSGHGANLMSDEQNRVLLAFSTRGASLLNPDNISNTTVSLVDVTPTIIELAGLQEQVDMRPDGLSLVQFMHGNSHEQPRRAVYMETGFWLPGLSLDAANSLATSMRGASFYNINTEGRLVFDDVAHDFLISQKQFSAIVDDVQVVVAQGDNESALYFRNLEQESGENWLEHNYRKKLLASLSSLCMHFKKGLSASASAICTLNMHDQNGIYSSAQNVNKAIKPNEIIEQSPTSNSQLWQPAASIARDHMLIEGN